MCFLQTQMAHDVSVICMNVFHSLFSHTHVEADIKKKTLSLSLSQRTFHYWRQRYPEADHHEWPSRRTFCGWDSAAGAGIPVHRQTWRRYTNLFQSKMFHAQIYSKQQQRSIQIRLFSDTAVPGFYRISADWGIFSLQCAQQDGSQAATQWVP